MFLFSKLLSAIIQPMFWLALWWALALLLLTRWRRPAVIMLWGGLLVTSAWHMPRSMAEFEAVGCKVTPYPVDFRTGDATPLTEYSVAYSLMRWQTALHEWLGLLVYGVTR